MEHRLPHAQSRCAICDEPLERFWVHNFSERVHEECRPWHEVDWIYDDHEKVLRKCSSGLADKLLQRLRTLKRQWPRDALEIVREVGRRWAWLQERVPPGDQDLLARLR